MTDDLIDLIVIGSLTDRAFSANKEGFVAHVKGVMNPV